MFRPLASALLLLALHAGAIAQAAWPDKPIRMVIGYAPGGGADTLVRPIADRLSRLLGQPIVMDYRPGAGGALAAEAVAKAAPDGYTLHITDSGPMTIVPNLRRTAYNPLTDFTPLTMVCSGGTVLVVHPSGSAQTLPRLVEQARQNPAAWSYGTSGVGGVGHLAGEQFKAAAGLSMAHVPYKGGAPAMTELIGGHVPLLFSSLSAASAHIRGGRVVPLAVTSASRSAMFPQVPTLAESGYPGFDASIWFGIVGPAGLPPQVTERLMPALATAMADPAVQEAIRREGYDPLARSGADMRAVIARDLARWGRTIKDANIKAD